MTATTKTMKKNKLLPSTTHSLWVLFRFLIIISNGHVSHASSLHEELFPSHDDYDSQILDPLTVFGSPLGGYSRATRSRLAAMPLRLPDILISNHKKNDDELDETKNKNDLSLSKTVWKTSDGMGRGYVCRVYHQDELESTSIHESMFDIPRETTIVDTHNKKEDVGKQNGGDDNDNINENHSQQEEEEEDEEEEIISSSHPDISSPNQIYTHDTADEATLLAETQRRLDHLKGICAQIHLGWWSYQWCYGNDQEITQFHVSVDEAGSGLDLVDVSSLGKFYQRKFQIVQNKNYDNSDPAIKQQQEQNDDYFVGGNKFAQDEPELARVVDIFQNGDVCDATGKPRHTIVRYFCCSEQLMNRYKGPVLRDGNPTASGIVSIIRLLEDPEEPCYYTINVCTPLLCQDIKGSNDDALLLEAAANARSLQKDLPATHRNKGAKKGNESVRDILDRALGKGCIQSSSSSSWWSYEICYGKRHGGKHGGHIRQFHESISIDLSSGVTSTSKGDTYMLGFYKKELDDYPDSEEWKYVVNSTSTTTSSAATSSDGSGSSSVGAYFTTEFVGGDVCDDADVTDSAITAGTVGTKKLERASSVRFSCGNNYDVYVKEDHTCHYIVDVTLPELCDHPFFKAPETKKRVIKCLPVEGVSEWEE